MKGGDIWNGYIDFEMTNNHLGFVNLLCYMAVKTPLLMASDFEQKYLGILDSLFDDIVLDINREDFTVGEKYKAKQAELVKLMFEDCKGDKFEFMQKIKDIAVETKSRVHARLHYEDKINKIYSEGGSLDQEKQAWSDYIKFELE